MAGYAADNEEILAVLEKGLSERLGGSLHILQFDRRQYEYWSSCSLEELNIQLDDGRRMTLLFKDFSPHILLEATGLARHQLLFDPAREICVYTKLLNRLSLRTAVCYAAKIDVQINRYWMFLEKVSGRELYKIAELSVWEEAARWLACFHRLASDVPPSSELRLLDWDRNCYEQCLERARFFRRPKTNVDVGNANRFDWMAAVYTDVIEHLLSRPKSVIHGEFYASNVLVEDEATGVQVCPIDWETAGWGPALIDLAALVAGRWDEEQRSAMVRAYWKGLNDEQRNSWGTKQVFQRTLIGCRLHLAVQMLGRPPEWEPPAEHKQDWHREASQLAAEFESAAINGL